MSEPAYQCISGEAITRCICGFTHDDGYMIWCDGCSVWHHLVCMELDQTELPEKYYCEVCLPRLVNTNKARIIQKRISEFDLSGENTVDLNNDGPLLLHIRLHGSQPRKIPNREIL